MLSSIDWNAGLVTSKTSKSLANVFTGDFLAACFFGDFGDGDLKERENLNAVVTIFCTADESLNTFTVTGTNSSGTTITEQIKGTTASNTAEGLSKFSKITSITTSAAASGTIKIGTKADTVVGSTKFTTITSIETSATGNGNIKIGTAGHNDINDDDSLVQLTSFISGTPIGLNGVLSTSEYLGAKIQIKSQQDTTGTTFIIAGIGLNNEVIEERILGSNSGVVTTNNIFKSKFICRRIYRKIQSGIFYSRTNKSWSKS